MELDDICPFGRCSKQLVALDLKAKEKYWLGRAIVDRRQTCANLMEKYELSKSILYYYANAYKNGVVLHDGPGRPGVLSPVEENKLVSFLKDGDYQIKTVKFYERLQDLAVERAVALHKSAAQVKGVSRRTRARVEEKLAIKTGNTETTTNARAIATADVRNAVSYVVMNKFMTSLVSPYLILNVFFSN